MAKTIGPNAKYTDPKVFASKVDDFIAHCEDTNTEPTDYQITKYFNVSPRTLDRYRAGYNISDSNSNRDEYKYKAFGEALKKIDLFREDYTIRQAVANPKLTGHCAHKLKQAHWGGWIDKAEQEAQKLEIEVKIKGCDDSVLV